MEKNSNNVKFGVPGFFGCSGVFRAVPGCSGLFRGVPGCFVVFWAVPGCSGVFRGVPGCSGVFRGVPGCSRVFRCSGVPGFLVLVHAVNFRSKETHFYITVHILAFLVLNHFQLRS